MHGITFVSSPIHGSEIVDIENQFFVSLVNNSEVQNEICKVLAQRIVLAHKMKETFRVFILLPLMPGFEGDISMPGSSALQVVLHWIYQSLSRGPNSLMHQLAVGGVIDPSKYLSVCSLRTHDILCGKLVSELIYVHSKLMIVDDEHVIIGSANINDRSQVGNRDSEVCLRFSGGQRVPSTLGGRPFQAQKFAKSLRIRLMKVVVS